VCVAKTVTFNCIPRNLKSEIEIYFANSVKRHEVLGIARAGVPRKKSSDNHQVESVSTNPPVMSSSALTLKVFDENKQLFEEIQRAQKSIPPAVQIDSG
jgi:hypothetical protein